MMYTPKTSDEAVKKATGKAWTEWFSILDKAGAKKMPHIEIAQYVYDNYLGEKKTKLAPDVAKKGGWWSQMVTVEYERSRGLRKVGETATGFNVSVHRTVGVPISRLFGEWRKIAAKNKLVESTVRPNKTIRYKRDSEGVLYVVMFAAKESGSRVGFEVIGLKRQSDIEKMRVYWKKQMEKLEQQLT